MFIRAMSYMDERNVTVHIYTRRTHPFVNSSAVRILYWLVLLPITLFLDEQRQSEGFQFDFCFFRLLSRNINSIIRRPKTG